MWVLPSGTKGLLVELDDLAQVLGLYAALNARRERGELPVTDLVPAGRTVLVVAEEGTDLRQLAHQLQQVEPTAATAGPAPVVEVPVRYDGPDLTETAAHLGCSPTELVERHQAEEWTVAFCGFSPGFGYLTGTRFSWQVPRRPEPRVRVPAGSLALAGEFTGVYPRESPGGWQLIGRALVPVFDAEAEPPALLVPGARVRFVAAP